MMSHPKTDSTVTSMPRGNCPIGVDDTQSRCIEDDTLFWLYVSGWKVWLALMSFVELLLSP